MSACKSTRRLQEGENLLVGNKIILDEEGTVSASDLDYVLKQKPNRKIFGFIPFHLFMYNLPNPEKLKQDSTENALKKEERKKKLKTEIEELDSLIFQTRLSIPGTTGKERKKLEKKVEKMLVDRNEKEEKVEKYKPRFGIRVREWLRNSVGEAPVVLDSSKVISSRKNLTIFLFKKGYFNNVVRDSVGVDTSRKKARVYYFVELNAPYIIDSFAYKVSDPKLAKQIEISKENSLIKPGNNLDFEKLDEERARITTFLKDKGYYFFSKEYIYYDVDSSMNSRRVKVTMGVNNMLKSSAANPDSLTEVPHRRFLINEIYVNTDFDPRVANIDSLKDKYDTLLSEEHYFIYRNNLKFKTSTLLDAIYINKTYTYRAKEVEATYKKLSSLGVFKSVNIQFELNPDDPTQSSLNCYINLVPNKKQSITLEANGTNKSGNLGIMGNYTYKNKNSFKGAETYRFSITGGLEAQQLLANEDESILGENTNIKPLKTFNTLEFGPEMSLFIPKILTPIRFERLKKLSKYQSPKTVFTATLNYQNRPDFKRIVQDVSLGYDWRKGDFITKHFQLLSISAIKIEPDSSFTARLNQINDQFLLNSYRDHFILGSQASWTYNNQDQNKLRNGLYLRISADVAGNGMRLLYDWRGVPHDSSGTIFGIRFAHYVKMDTDIRYKIVFNRSSSIVYRMAGGVGKPFRNFDDALPFEKSFFAGGSNGLRGWRARTLGPGSYTPLTTTFDKIGDILIEGNLEYRFDLVDFFEGALFVDAGNIWNLKENPARPGSGFSTDFYREIAMDAGLGLRFDLDFFIVRFDFALPIRDPAMFEGERWIFEKKSNTNNYLITNGADPYKARLNWNLGIGYPF